MDLGTIVVLTVAFLFFGGIGYLSWSQWKKQKLNIDKQAASASDSGPQSPEVKERKRVSR